MAATSCVRTHGSPYEVRQAEVLAILALTLLAAPLATEAQQPGRVPRVGILGNVRSHHGDVFERALKDLGYEDGKNIILEWRLTQGDPARLPELVAGLVRLKVDVIWAADETRVNAVRQATNTIPIVFTVVGDPVGVGYAVSLARPGGMITGVSSQWSELVGKRLEILKEALPNAKPVAVLTWRLGFGQECGRGSAKGYAGVLTRTGSERPVAALAAGEGCSRVNGLTGLRDLHATTKLGTEKSR